MSALQLESGIAVMIEFAGSPIGGCMAAVAIGYLHRYAVDFYLLGELPLMDIIMAAFTGAFQTRKPQAMLGNILINRQMAFPASHLRMLTLESKACQFMIERYFPPGIDIMAIPATLGLRIFIGLPGVRIFMAIGAAA